MMKCNLTGAVLVSAVLLTASCATRHYQMTGIDRTRVLVDQRYDQQPDAEAARLLAPYTHTVDSIMSPIVGETTHYMSARRPESDLSNLLGDILVWGGEQRGDHPDFGLYNMGGIRASLPEGKVTYGDLVDVAPFDNKLCLLTLTGEKTLQLFREIASVGGEGVSHGVELVITKDGKLVSARINGKEIDPAKSYRVATLDYLAQGNDRLEAFLSKTDVVSPDVEENNVRYLIRHYFEEMTRQGKKIDTQKEGRIVIE